jgi:hypothetical protein
MAKIHLHDEQFDGHMHAFCGSNGVAFVDKKFEATTPVMRCKKCECEWFPHGQPDWHFQQAVKSFSEISTQDK